MKLINLLIFFLKKLILKFFFIFSIQKLQYGLKIIITHFIRILIITVVNNQLIKIILKYINFFFIKLFINKI